MQALARSFFGILFLAAMMASPVAAKPFKVIAVHDGDTLTVAGEWAIMDGRKVALRIPGSINIRLLGIDTPEIGSRAKCPAENALADRARDNLRRLVAGGTVDVTAARHDKYGGRLLAVVKVDGMPVSAAQIAGGFAAAYDGSGPRHEWCGELPALTSERE
jgi:endonuclease YncB( thermonuclease family)